MKTETKVHYALRIAVAMCFIGHGAFGIITKEIWCNYFGVFGIGKQAAYALMPWVGAADIALGISMLFYPTRAVALWLIVWGSVTAFLRPLSGEPFAEFIERAGNFGAPLALILLSGGVQNVKQLFQCIDPSAKPSAKTLGTVSRCLTVVVFLLLAGHGILNLLGKKGLLSQYASLGFSQPGRVAIMAGVFELGAAVLVLIRPMRSMLVLFLVWKISTELFYPHYEVFEWIERGGSYGSILALLFSLEQVTLNFKLPAFHKQTAG